MSWPRVPEATITPEANDLLYPDCSIAGREISPMVVTVAAVTPVVAAIRLPTSTTASASPPRSWPSSCPMACSRRSAMPEVCSMAPMNTKVGIASSVKLLMIPKILEGRALKKSGSIAPRAMPSTPKITATPPRPKATG